MADRAPITDEPATAEVVANLRKVFPVAVAEIERIAAERASGGLDVERLARAIEKFPHGRRVSVWAEEIAAEYATPQRSQSTEPQPGED